MAELVLSPAPEQSISLAVNSRPFRVSGMTHKTDISQTHGITTQYKRAINDGTPSVCFNEKIRRVVVPSDLDLPCGVIKSTSGLGDSELMPSVFGGFSQKALEKAHVIGKKDLESFNEIRSKMVSPKGIEFKKCSRSSSKVQSRVLVSNPCFTSFRILEGKRERTFYASDFVGLAKGKASEELKKNDAVYDQNCLVLIATDRTLSTVWESEQKRDEMYAALKVLLHLKPANC